MDGNWRGREWIGIGLAVCSGAQTPSNRCNSDVALTLIEPYCMYWVAEQFHSSGLLAMVAGGLFLSTKRLVFLSSTSRIKGYSVWESLVFILNGLVFLIIGLELPEVVGGLSAVAYHYLSLLAMARW